MERAPPCIPLVTPMRAPAHGRCRPWLVILLMAVAPLAAAAPQATPSDAAGAVQVSVSPLPDAGAQPGARYRPGGQTRYEIRAANVGPSSYRGRLQAPLPAGIARARWTCQAEAGARCAAARGEGGIDAPLALPGRSSVRYTFTIDVPQDYPQTHAFLELAASMAPGNARGSARLLAIEPDPATRPQVAPTPQTPPAGSASPPAAGERTAVPVQAPAVPVAPRAGTGLQSSPGGLRSGVGTTRLLALAGPFTQCGPDMFITQAPTGQDNTTLSRVNTGTVPFTLTPLGTGSVPYNAVGFRPADNFLYGIRIGTTSLVRIHADGATEVLGAVNGLPAPPGTPVNNSYNAGEIGTDGFLYVKTQSAVSAIYRIDLSTLPGTATRINLVGGTVSGADMAWINGRLYTVNQNGTVAWINPATGQVTTLPVSNGALGNVGALFGTPTALYGSRNDPGGFYQFDLVTGRATRLSGSPVVGSNDGAHCAAAPITFGIDVGVTKTNTPAQGPNDLPNDTYLPGTNVVYSIVVSNRGPVGVQNMRVQDVLPPGITTASWTCQITQGEGECGQTAGTGGIDDALDLEFDELTRVVSQATYTLTMAVPLAYPQSQPALTNVVDITLPSGYIDATPADNSATDTDPAPQADLSVVKATPSVNVRAGDTITYTLTATNLGPADVADAVLTDTANSHLDCATPTAPPTCIATGAAVCPAALSRSLLFGSGLVVPSLPANNGAVVVTVSCLVTP